MTIENAEVRGWGSGWPNCHPEMCQTLTRADGVRIMARAEILPLVAWLLDETERRGYNVRPGDTGAFNCRQIRQTGIPSNHSWGLAVDINWQSNPAGDFLSTDMPDWMIQIWEAHGFRWGGHYSGLFKDAMHYEFMGTPADASRIISELHGTPNQTGSLEWVTLTQGMADGRGPLVDDAHKFEVLEVQLRLVKAKKLMAGQYWPDNYDYPTQLAYSNFKEDVRAIQRMTHQREWPRMWGLPGESIIDQLGIGVLRFFTS